MAVESTATRLTALCDAAGYVVESPHGDVGQVEEVWLDGDGPCAPAVKVEDGRRALLLARDVVAIDREHHWVVVPEEAQLLELDAPRLSSREGSPAASWATTGNVVAVAAPDTGHGGAREAKPRTDTDRPLWEMVAILYVGLLVVVVFVMALAFAAQQLA